MRAHGRRRFWALALVGVAVVVAAGCVPPHPSPPVSPEGELDPGLAAHRLRPGHASGSWSAGRVHLDPSCTYTRGIDITDVEHHARLPRRARSRSRATSEDRQGILIETPVDVPLDHVTVRNCDVAGFTPNNLRDPARGLQGPRAGRRSTRTAPTSDIRIEHSKFSARTASGIFLDGFVTGVTLATSRSPTRARSASTSRPARRTTSSRTAASTATASRTSSPRACRSSSNGTELRYESTGPRGHRGRRRRATP